MYKLLLLLFAALLQRTPSHAQIRYANPSVERSAAYLAGNPCQRDLLLFVDLLRTTHPAFCKGVEAPFSADSVAEAGYRLAARCRTAEELHPLLQRIAAGLHDGHTRIDTPSGPRSHYPIQLFLDGEGLYLQAVAPEYRDALGKRIERINDRPAREVLESFRTAVCCDNDAGFRRSVNRIVQTPALWRQNACGRPDSGLLLTFTDGERLLLKPLPGKVRNLMPVPRTKAPSRIPQTREPFASTFLPDRGVCYLAFNSCQDQGALRLMCHYTGTEITPEVERKLQRIPRFDRFAEEMFRRIEADSITTLVIDLRRNGGGNSLLCDVLLSWLRPRHTLKRYTSQIRLSPLWEQQYARSAEAVRGRFARSQQSLDPDRLYDWDEVMPSEKQSDEKMQRWFEMNEDSTRCFRGRVVVVQGEKTYSSAGILATMIADNGIGTIVGVPGTFRPTHYGDLLSWELPNTGLRGSVSSKLFRRPDRGRDREDSLLPDVVLVQTWEEYLRGADPVGQWLFEGSSGQ